MATAAPALTTAPTTAALAAPTAAPAQTPATKPPPSATALPAPQAPMPTTKPSPQTPAATTDPSPTPVLQTVFDDFGFSLGVERGANVQAGATATPQQGVVTFAYGGINTIMIWTPPGEAGPVRLVAGAYSLLQRSQQTLSFETISDGRIVVVGEPGVFLGFKAVDASGFARGGLIRSWTCEASGTSFTLALTGNDAVLVQVRFDELIRNFACSSP